MKKMLKPGLSVYLTIALAFSGCSLIDDDNDVTITTERKMLLSQLREWTVDGIVYQEKEEYKYDANGNRIKKETTHIDDGIVSSVTTEEFNANGDHLEYVFINDGEVKEKYKYRYDQHGREVTVYQNDKLIKESRYEYNGNTVNFSTTQYTDKGTKKTDGTEVYTDSDLKYMVSSKSEVVEADGQKSIEEIKCSYKYDGNGNIIETTTESTSDGIPTWFIQTSIDGNQSITLKISYYHGEENMNFYDETVYTDSNREYILYHKYNATGVSWGTNITEEYYEYNDEGNLIESTFYENDILGSKNTNYVYKNNIVTYTNENYDDNGNTTTRYYYTLTYEE